jgi:hypothetical protein
MRPFWILLRTTKTSGGCMSPNASARLALCGRLLLAWQRRARSLAPLIGACSSTRFQVDGKLDHTAVNQLRICCGWAVFLR